jgi:small subunit ribosomal protein S7
MVEKVEAQKFKLFDIWDVSNIEVKDAGLKSVINLDAKLLVKSNGRYQKKKDGKSKVNVLERLVNKISVAGHRNKKHKIELGHTTGKYTKNMNAVITALKIVEAKTGKNPVEVLVRAIENSAPRDEMTVIEYGGARYPQAVDISPVRRISLALKNLAHGSSDKAFGKKKKLSQTLAEEIMLASDLNGESFAIRRRKESEAQADSAR